MADFTYVPTWTGMVYVAFVFDVFSRGILGWRAATTKKTQLVLDALEMAIWRRTKDGQADLSGLVHHNESAQYTSITWPGDLSANRGESSTANTCSSSGWDSSAG